MPWKIEERNGKHCVIKKTDGTVEDCHDRLQDAKDHMAALYASENKSKDLSLRDRVASFLDFIKGGSGAWYATAEGMRGEEVATPRNIMFVKQHGLWHWFGAISNNIFDKEKQIISAKAHRRFVKALDDGTYKGIFGHEMPELWVWHLPVAIGDGLWAAYDEENGFLLGAGVQREGEFYDKAFEKLAAWAAESPHEVAMSHGAPEPFLEWEVEGEVIDGYLDKEWTILPNLAAANKYTVAGVTIMKKEGHMKIPDRKRKWFMETFGEEIVEAFDNKLAEMSADAADLPRKELNTMSEETQEKAQVEEAQVEETSEEVAATETPAAEVTADGGEAEVKQTDGEEEEEEEEMDGEEKDTRYITESDLTEVVTEIMKGIKAGIAEALTPIREQQEQLAADVGNLQKEVGVMSQTNSQRIAKAAADTPLASLSEHIARSIADTDRALVTKEDSLHGPEEEEDTTGGRGTIHVPALAKQIQASHKNGRRRVYSGAGFGQS